MKIKEVRDKDTAQLHHDLVERRRHLFDLRTQAVTEKLEDPSQLRKTRKEIARIMTILRQRELEQSNNPAETAAGTEAAAQTPAT